MRSQPSYVEKTIMPIALQCASCQASLKAPDSLAGKKVKCPKCGLDIVVSVNNLGVAARLPVARPPAQKANIPPPGRADTGSPPVRLPLLSFDELKVPPRLRRCIEKEVGDEQILWLGRPRPESLLSKARIGMWAGLIITIITLVATISVLLNLQGAKAILIGCGIAGLILLTLGLPMATMPVWIRWIMNYRDCYVLTQTRAIVFDNEKILWAKAKPYAADRLGQRALRVKSDGSGSIVFGTEVIDLGIREKRRKRTESEQRGGREVKVQVTTVTRKREKADKAVGFLDIEEVEKVEAMLRQVLRLGPPASKEVE